MPSIRPVTEADADAIQALAAACPPLDVHTAYTYWVMARYDPRAFLVLHDDTELLGFVLGLVRGDVLFIWQVAVVGELRGQGWSQRLLGAAWAAAGDVTAMELTMLADNTASLGAFERFGAARGLRLAVVAEMSVADDSGRPHPELVYRLA